jgi:hypothetical protein
LSPKLRDNLQPTDFAEADCRVSPWSEFRYHNCVAVRVWVCKVGNYWFQRHEWQIEGKNATQLDDWIFSGYRHGKSHAPHMLPAPDLCEEKTPL